MKKIRFPPMAALRAFETAARHLSFTRAAEELAVTQSAVSHQIKHIEELWGFKLFEKRGRRLMLTEQAQVVVPIVREFFRKLESTLVDLSETEEETTGLALRVTLLQAFAFKWLVPRLGHFNQSHPDIAIWLSTTNKLIDFNDSDADLAIRLGYGNWGNLYEERLMEEYIFPVCSPRFLEEHDHPKDPADLLNLPLLRRSAVDILQRWRDWFLDAGVVVKKMPKGTQYPEASLTLQAAIDGQGIALARSAHVLDDIKEGRLIRLFPEIKSKSNIYYFFVCRLGRENEPEITAFRQWLKQEVQQAKEDFETFLD